MRIKLGFAVLGMHFLFVTESLLLADQVDLKNGDRYVGKVLSVTSDTVIVQSEVLGKINVPRKNVTSLSFSTNAVAALKPPTNTARIFGSTNLPAVVALTDTPAETNVDLAAAFRNLGANTNFVRQIREQMLADSPAAASKYDEMVNGLMSGTLNMNDLRREAKSSADQLRSLKRELGPEVGDSLDMYLQVLDGFLKESAAEPTVAAPNATPHAPVR